MLEVAGPIRFEHVRETLGIGVAAPRLSWRVETDASGWKQTAYELEAVRDGGAIAWATGRVESRGSVLVAWPGLPLGSRDRLTARVRVWGNAGEEPSAWSEPSVVEAGLLEPADWQARFIAPVAQAPTGSPCPYLRREFVVRGGVTSARLYVTALGVYESEINGARIGDHVLAPGWNSYDHRLRYQAFDVTGALREGTNVIGAVVGHGWYRGRLGFPGAGGENLYGDRVALLAQLEMRYADGSAEVVATDTQWRTATGPILSSSIYDGEVYDARLEMSGWSSAGFDDAGWGAVEVVERDFGTLIAPSGPPVRRFEAIEPVAVMKSPGGKTILDFGQNMSGRLRLEVDAPAGTTITLRHAEVLQDGGLCTWPLRGAKATDEYIARGGREEWEPRFTYHGFRYVEVEGWPGEIKPGAIRAVVCHSDMERTGWFECSDPLINRLHENVVWSMRSNFVDVPTDCPQRDERLGWTGDITVFSPTACFLYDAAGFLTNWLGDLAADQLASGVVPVVIPDVLNRGPEALRARFGGAQAVWGDAAVIVPWVLYQRFGDAGILATQYESMKRWVEHVADLAGPERLWNHGFQLADWLDPAAPPERPAQAMTDPHLVATAYFAFVSDLLRQIAAILGHGDDEARYGGLSDEVRAAFRRAYVQPDGRLASDTQTAYALAIEFDLFATAEQREQGGRRLESIVRHNDYRVGTGFAGTPLILDSLCAVDETAAAFRMLTERSCPSWLYPVTMGATTIWERWDSLRPDGSVNPGQMTSFNHYALGAVADWLHRAVAGLIGVTPGYHSMFVGPIEVGGGLTWASASHMTPHGMASVKWRVEDDRLDLDVVVAPNSEAVVWYDPLMAPREVGSGSHHFSLPLQKTAPLN